MNISDEAVEAAAKALWQTNQHDDEWTSEFPTYMDYLRAEATKVLEAAAPYIISSNLLTLAEDTRARGDIGKDGGVEAWDYLTFHADKAITNPYRSQA